jgi:lipopolysaccharide transport system permease protein
MFLVWRDIKLRYAQTLLGMGWALLQPLLAMAIFSVIFGRFAKLPSDGVPYSVFCLAALVPWTYFSTAFTTASTSLVLNTNLLTKVYFPRLVIPAAPVLAGLLDLAIASMLLAALMAWHGIMPSLAALLMVPLLVALLAITAFGIGTWLAALNIQFRDVKYATPFLAQVWFYASPIVYPTSLVPAEYRFLYALNPMVGIMEGFRAVLLGTQALPWSALAVSTAASLLLLVTGTLYFRRTERVFADVA